MPGRGDGGGVPDADGGAILGRRRRQEAAADDRRVLRRGEAVHPAAVFAHAAVPEAPREAGAFAHQRSHTAYQDLNDGSRPGYGPHVIAHVTTAVVIEDRVARGGSFRRIRPRSRLRLSPGQENALAHRLLAQRAGGDPQVMRRQRVRFVTRHLLLNHHLDRAERLEDQAIYAGAIIEASALQTYAIDRGHVTDAEIAGNGENRGAAAEDLWRLSNRARDTAALDLRTIDGISERPGDFVSLHSDLGRQMLNRARQMGRFHHGAADDTGSQLSEATIGSLNDSVMDEATRDADSAIRRNRAVAPRSRLPVIRYRRP